MENYLEALNPQRSAVVEACAGSGKTWMLVSRILRLLLDGVPPAEILAITFTRLAAREMEERLLEWLTFLAVQSDEAVLMFLAERGLAVGVRPPQGSDPDSGSDPNRDVGARAWFAGTVFIGQSQRDAVYFRCLVP